MVRRPTPAPHRPTLIAPTRLRLRRARRCGSPDPPNAPIVHPARRRDDDRNGGRRLPRALRLRKIVRTKIRRGSTLLRPPQRPPKHLPTPPPPPPPTYPPLSIP